MKLLQTYTDEAGYIRAFTCGRYVYHKNKNRPIILIGIKPLAMLRSIYTHKAIRVTECL